MRGWAKDWTGDSRIHSPAHERFINSPVPLKGGLAFGHLVKAGCNCCELADRLWEAGICRWHKARSLAIRAANRPNRKTARKLLRNAAKNERLASRLPGFDMPALRASRNALWQASVEVRRAVTGGDAADLLLFSDPVAQEVCLASWIKQQTG